ncbi:hypothetical protein C8R43DRAFT_112589 [Mycena crocata]|nr:hypothetical protein C8R43DRAFT_112589 [Mycena crocata]
MANHLLSTTLFTLISCAGNNAVQYAVISLLASYFGIRLARPFLPSARMNSLEELIADTTDLLHRADEERMLSNHQFHLDVQLKLSRVSLTKSTLRSKILGLKLCYRLQEYLLIMGIVSRNIEQCKREVKDIQIAILTEVEAERQRLYNDQIVILSSGFSLQRMRED